MEKQWHARRQNNPGGKKTRRQKNPISTVYRLRKELSKLPLPKHARPDRNLSRAVGWTSLP